MAIFRLSFTEYLALPDFPESQKAGKKKAEHSARISGLFSEEAAALPSHEKKATADARARDLSAQGLLVEGPKVGLGVSCTVV